MIIGRTATASSAFLLDDLAGTRGRLAVLVRRVPAALLTSPGVRQDTAAFLVLLGGERAPRTVRIRGETAKFLRPDGRSLAVLVQKALSSHADDPPVTGFAELRHHVLRQAVTRRHLDNLLVTTLHRTITLV